VQLKQSFYPARLTGILSVGSDGQIAAKRFLPYQCGSHTRHYHLHWRRKDFFPGGWKVVDFFRWWPQAIFQGRTTVVKVSFINLKLKENIFLIKTL